MEKGFTLLELVVVIVLVSILAVGASALWQSGMDKEAAVREFKHALRFAQHLAMTREYDPNHPWGLEVGPSGTTYSVRRKEGGYAPDPASSQEYKDRSLPGGASTTCPSIWFDRFGAPIGVTAPVACTVAGRGITIYPETGYVE